MTHDQNTQQSPTSSLLEIFLIFLRLGLTSFGGPIAHLGYFREEFVEKRKWLDDHNYSDLVALCQFLPGPASSQVGIAVGLMRGGALGALASWLGFTLPSAIAMVAFALFMQQTDSNGSWIHGLKVVAVAVVAQAIWGMGKTLCPDRNRATIAVIAATFLMVFPSVFGQVAVILTGGLIGWLWLSSSTNIPNSQLHVPLTGTIGAICLLLFFALLIALPALAHSGPYWLKLVDGFYRSGALVFGGGHVVLPLIQAEVVPTGWVSNDAFIAGYGAAQAVPGPLFTFSAYLGAASSQSPNGWLGAAMAVLAIFIPAFLLVFGTLPLWQSLRRFPSMQKAMLGVNAAVVGVLLAAFYNPVWTSAILSPKDFALALTAFLLLVFWKSPPWMVVLFCAAAAGLGWH